jgi:hypothetical protein
MSSPGRPKGESLKPQAEGPPVNAPGRSQALIPERAARTDALPPGAEAVGEPQRRAALTLHALDADDRHWVLARLPEGQRALMSGLLAELRALRIPSDRRLLDHALETRGASAAGPGAEAAPGPGEPAAVPAPSVRSGPEVADRPLPADLLRRVGHEPPFVLATCLLDLPAAEQARVLARLAPGRAAAVRELMAGGLAGAALLRRTVRQALHDPLPPGAPAATSAGGGSFRDAGPAARPAAHATGPAAALQAGLAALGGWLRIGLRRLFMQEGRA